MNEELLGLLGATPEQIAQARRRSGFEELGLLGQALMQAGAPAPRGTSTLSRLGQAAGMYTQAPRQTMDTLLQDLLRRQQIQEMQRKRKQEQLQSTELEKIIAGLPADQQAMARAFPSAFAQSYTKPPEYMKIKGPDGSERLVEIGKTGVTPINVPGLSGGLKFPNVVDAYIDFKYPGKTYEQLNAVEKADVLRFQNAPTAKELADIEQAAKKLQFETGTQTPIPSGRESFFSTTPASVPSPVSAVKLEPTVAITETPQVQLVSGKPTPQTAAQLGLKVSSKIAGEPLKENEKPLIESSAISPKNKQELLLAQPKQTQAVEYVLETNTQLLNAINEALVNPGFDDAFGLTGSIMSRVGSSNAARVKELLTKIGGNLFIEAITAMRAASATGAAVGSVTEREGEKLEKSRAALGQAQRAEDARKELETLKRALEFQRDLVTNAYERTYGRGSFLQREPVKPKDQRKSLESIFGGQQ